MGEDENPNPPKVYDRIRFGLMAGILVLIVAVVVAFTILRTVHKTRGRTANVSPSIDIIQGDFGVKVALSSDWNSTFSKEFLRQSIASYTKAFPSTDALRRAAILKADVFGESGYSLIPIKKLSPDERDFWRRALDTKPLTRSEATAMAKRADRMQLGPLQGVLEARIYRLARMKAEAASAMAESVKRATASVMVLGLALGVVAIANLVGLWLFFTVGIRALRRPGGAVESLPGPKLRLAGFVTYLFAYLAILTAGAGTFLKSSVAGMLFFQGCASLAALALGVRASGAGAAAFLLPARDDMRPQVRMGLVGYLAVLPVAGAANALGPLLFKSMPEVEHPLIGMMTHGGWLVLALAFIFAAVAAPIVEETMFRGVLFGSLRARMGFWPACLATSTVFAALHPTSPGQFAPLFILGIALAILRERSGSLVPGMVCHALNNAVATLMAAAMLL